MGRMGWVFVVVGLFAAAFSMQAGKPIEADKSYDTGVAKVELLGVCRASETEVECWGPDGRLDETLREQLKDLFLRNEFDSVPVRYGTRTRVAIFRFTNPWNYDPRGTIEAYFQSSRGSLSWPNRMSSSEDPQRVEVRATVIFAKPHEQNGQVSTVIRKSAPPSKRMAIKEGASLDYVGSRFTVRKIAKVPADAPPTFGISGSRWTIVMTATNQLGYPLQLGWTAIGKDGLVIRAVDAKGTPVLVDPSAIQPVFSRSGFEQPSKYSRAVFGSSAGLRVPMEGDDYLITTNIDPSKIKEVYLVGSSTERLTIGGIPLEPAKRQSESIGSNR